MSQVGQLLVPVVDSSGTLAWSLCVLSVSIVSKLAHVPRLISSVLEENLAFIRFTVLV